MLEYYQLELD